MTTFHEVIERTRRRLMTTQREALSTLGVSSDSSQTTWNLSTSPRFTENSRLSCDLEDVYVVQGPSASDAQVLRGMYGSTAAAHTAGTVVHVDPTWTNWDIAQAVNDELADLSSPINGLFRVRSVDFDYSPSRSGYNLAGVTDLLDVWRVRFRTSGSEEDWPIVPRRMWRLDQAADTTDFADGLQLVLREGGSAGQPVRVSYRATFDPLVAVADDVLTVSGLHAEAHDILSLGAAIRLLSGLAAARAYTTTQPDPRRAAETQSRDAAIAAAPLADIRTERVRAESARLARKYPQAL